MSNSAMINSVRDFKKARSNQTDNVVDIRSQPSLAEMHFARADEAHIEVTIETPTETFTCEDVTMTTNTTTTATVNTMADAVVNADQLKTAMSGVAQAVEEVLNNPEQLKQRVSDQQVETVSVRDIAAARKSIRAKQIFENVSMAVVAAATISAAGRKFGRSKKAADITAGIFGGLIAYNGFSELTKVKASQIAKHGDDEEVAASSTIDILGEVIPSVVGSVVVGSFIGRFLVRKAKEVIDDVAE